ncbi:MAG: hypothetical protein HY695_28590 [Deltaproteobacteria bacterium]|nr:hypothetical protein [Deltaproteobacteria bacterium]
MKKRWWPIILLGIWLALGRAPALRAAPASKPFYEGKTIRLVVGYSPGGGFDVWSRLIARHMSRHVPGEPSIVVQNMPGGASLVAANWVYATQRGDGLTMVNFNGAHVVNAIVGLPEVKFDPEKFLWVGSPTPGFQPQVLYVRPEIAKTLEQFLKAAKPVRLGATGQGTHPFQLAKFLEIGGANVRLVGGYPGTNDVYVAIERKEVDGIFSSQESADTTFKRYSDDGIVVPLLKFGRDNPGLRRLNVPNFPELVKKMGLAAELDTLGKFLINSYDLARMYALPPGTPAERVTILRNAFQDCLKDPKFLEEATKGGNVSAPVTASEIEELVASMTKTPNAVKELYKKLFQ